MKYVFRKTIAMRKERFDAEDAEWLNFCDGKECSYKSLSNGKFELFIQGPEKIYCISPKWCQIME